MAESPLISVRTQVVLDTLVGTMAQAVTLRLGDPLDPEVEAALEAVGGDRRLTRLGYLARAEEVERFDRAREAMPWLADELAGGRTDGVTWSQAAASVAAELAAAEPAERPEPGDDRAISWKVPGPGGHVRYYLAARAASEDGERPTADARRNWLTGFLIHCLREAAPQDQR